MVNNKGIQFSKARKAGNSVKVFTNTPPDYRQLVTLLDFMKRPFFTYQLKEDKMDRRVIRGLPREMSTEDIKEDLANQGITDAEAQQIKARTTKKPLPLFLVKTKMADKLQKIQGLAMLTVSFEKKKKSTEPSQCYRCQRYGHTQRNCRLAERCVKCGEDHNSTSCSLPTPPTGQRIKMAESSSSTTLILLNKINNLRCAFRKELKKVRKSKRSGESCDNIYVPTLWYFELLMFTADQEEPRVSLSNDIESDEENQIQDENGAKQIVYNTDMEDSSSLLLENPVTPSTESSSRTASRCSTAELQSRT
ncbi:unnamed protein product [Acanthoscelides obtectus]|uniref:CCHC-type domain-containing protein n=1 Tax=Acanthoscelides obtectus TaxID=200917 RepID=A0A9P0NS70_ACAOB|nr:unnamed protein product [Acanthoscelides obtectus]CAK1672341.1 Nucleic-acid-binding protein from transposon X-element [Acanthoscelides obtectus]